MQLNDRLIYFLHKKWYSIGIKCYTNSRKWDYMLKDLCFEVIQTCPNKCKFCSSNSSQDKQTIITLEHFKRTVMHFINQGGIEELSISGGEPFLHPDLFKMVKFCKDNGIRSLYRKTK